MGREVEGLDVSGVGERRREEESRKEGIKGEKMVEKWDARKY